MYSSCGYQHSGIIWVRLTGFPNPDKARLPVTVGEIHFCSSKIFFTHLCNNAPYSSYNVEVTITVSSTLKNLRLREDDV